MSVLLLGNDAVLLGESHDAVVRFAHSPNSSTESIVLYILSHSTRCGIHLHNAQLDRSVVFRVNDPVAGRTTNKPPRQNVLAFQVGGVKK